MEKLIKYILVPVNFTNSSENAIHIAIAMCKRHDASLHLLKVNKESDFPYPSGKNALLIGIRLESRVAELKSMESHARQIAESNHIKCYFHVEDGAFSKTVAEIAANFYCNLIVVQKKSGSGRLSLSLNRDVHTLIKYSSCPVMAVPGNCHHDRFQSILFPVWVKRTILTKLQAALPIIKKNESKVVLFGSVKSPNDPGELNMVYKLMNSVRALILLATQNIENEVEDSPGTAKSILRKAVERKSDLIVISANPNSGFRFFKQGYTRFIINHSPVPVLSVK